MTEEIAVLTLPHFPGYRIVRIIGVVHGLTVRTRGVGGKISASISGIFGGEVHSYTEECERSKAEALERLRMNAQQMGANAVIGADFETSDILAGTATVFSAYGTAVVVESEHSYQ
ncbi:MAG: YbjQ family protein [Candidatus Thorarchaeota archaeon]